MSTHIPHEFRLYPKDNYLGQNDSNQVNKKFIERTIPSILPLNREKICRKLIGYDEL